MIELRGIETFYWIATLGSFRAAADKLHTSQPAISQRITQLEQSLGVLLFDRDKRGIKLTAKGQALLPHAERMLEMKHDMLAVARAQNIVSGRLCIGVAETIVQTWLLKLIERVHTTFPDLVLEIEVDTTSILRTHLLSRRIDLAFLMGPLSEPNVENLPLCTYPLGWVASPRLELCEPTVTIERIAKWPIITYPATTKPYQAIRELLTQRGVRKPRMYGSGSLNMAIRMALDGIGTCAIAPQLVADELASGRLHLLQTDAGRLPDLYFTASWLQGADSHVAATVASMALQIAVADGSGISEADRNSLSAQI